MAGMCAGSRFIVSCAAALSLGAGAMLLSPQPAHAQGLFDLLGRIFRGAPPLAYNREAPRLLDNFPGESKESKDAPVSGLGGPYVAYCVRMCDGRYFPMPSNAGAPSMTPQKMCSAMCPSAQTKVFSGTQIERAVASDGKSYSSIGNAFVYRERIVDDCSCNGRDTTGIAQMDAEADPTLRPGDIVVTAEGPKVYKGNRRTPHKVSDFVPAENYRGFPKSTRHALSQMRVSPEQLSATIKTGTSGPAPAAAAAQPGTPTLSMAPDGGEAMQGENSALTN